MIVSAVIGSLLYSFSVCELYHALRLDISLVKMIIC